MVGADTCMDVDARSVFRPTAFINSSILKIEWKRESQIITVGVFVNFEEGNHKNE
jgi:hypothetical protein